MCETINKQLQQQKGVAAKAIWGWGFDFNIFTCSLNITAAVKFSTASIFKFTS